MSSVEWLAADGSVLASSDAQQREAFISHVARHLGPLRLPDAAAGE
jgi:hypothetical protein